MAYEHSQGPYDDYLDNYIDNNNSRRQDDSSTENRNRNSNSHCHSQRHVHEFLGSTRLAEEGEDRHNHRFAGVTGQAIGCGSSHVHKIYVNTDFLDHFHEICITTGPAINIGNGKHIHRVTGMTTIVDGHRHSFIFATLIESPLT